MKIDAIDNDFSLTDDQWSQLLLLGSAEGHGVPRKLIYASIDARNVLCYRKDEDWPLGFALQDVIPNHHKLLWSKTTVVNVMGKGEAVTSSGVC